MEEDMTLLKENPFVVYFRNIKADNYHELQRPRSQMCNAYCLPEFVDFLVNSYLALSPLWTGLCLPRISCLAGKGRNVIRSFWQEERLHEFRETFEVQKKCKKNIYQAYGTWKR